MTLESKVTEFVVDKAQEYGLPEFNPSDRSELEAAAVQVLERSAVDPDGCVGSFVSVHNLKDDEPSRVVVKRMLKRPGPQFKGWKENLWYRGEDTPDAVFAFLEEEHRLVERYFGRQFVPDTLFLKIHSNMGNYIPAYFEKGTEWVMLQERAEGVRFYRYELSRDVPRETLPKAREPLLEFISCYKRMQREEKRIIEAQILIEEDTGRVSIVDTNYLWGFRQLENNPYFRRLTQEDPMDLSTEDLLRLIQEDPWVKEVYDKPLVESFPGKDMGVVSRQIYRMGGGEMGQGFELLARMTRLLPAYNCDNEFIRNLREKFGLPPD